MRLITVYVVAAQNNDVACFQASSSGGGGPQGCSMRCINVRCERHVVCALCQTA